MTDRDGEQAMDDAFAENAGTFAALASSDLVGAAARLTEIMGVPFVISGALADAYHARYLPADVRAIEIVIADPDPVQCVAADIGFTCSEVALGDPHLTRGEGVKLRGLMLIQGGDHWAGPLRSIRVRSPHPEIPGLTEDAIADATNAGRSARLFSWSPLVVSVGHSMAFHLVAWHAKDTAAIVELIKTAILAGMWEAQRLHVLEIVERHLGWHGARRISQLALVAYAELDRRVGDRTLWPPTTGGSTDDGAISRCCGVASTRRA